MVRKLIHHVTYIVLALAASVFTYNQVEWMYYKYRPVSDIYEASLFVPDFKQGEDPTVRYLNDKKEDFTGKFNIEVRNEDNITICRGVQFPDNGYEYQTTDKLPGAITLNWYLDKDPRTGEYSKCSETLPKGIYYINTNFDIFQANKPKRELETISNLFEVK